MTCVTPSECPSRWYRDIESFKLAVLTLLSNLVNGNAAPEAVFDALTAVPHTSIGAAYAVGASILGGQRFFKFHNQTDGDVMVSMDGGASNHYHIPSGHSYELDLGEMGLVSGALTISVKDGTVAPTSGSFYIYSVSA